MRPQGSSPGPERDQYEKKGPSDRRTSTSSSTSPPGLMGNETSSHRSHTSRKSQKSRDGGIDSIAESSVTNSQATSQYTMTQSHRRRRHSRKHRSGSGDNHHYHQIPPHMNSGGGREGPAVLTMLFVAVALATLFNMSKNSANAPPVVPVAGVAFKNNLRSGGAVPYAQHVHGNGYVYNYAVPSGAYNTQQNSEMMNPNVNIFPGQMGLGGAGGAGGLSTPVVHPPGNAPIPPLPGTEPVAAVAEPIVVPAAKNMENIPQGEPFVASSTAAAASSSTSTATDSAAAVAPAAAAPAAAAPAAAAVPAAAAEPIAVAAAKGMVPIENPELNGYKDTWDPWEETDQPVFWHIPKAGGSTIKDIMGTCHRFTMASEAGVYEGHDQDTQIKVVRPGGVPPDQDPSPFVNVDTTTVAGIERAKALGLAESGLADFIVTPFVYEGEQLFNPNARGRLFTVFRDPVDRALSLFFYLQVADWEPTYNPAMKDWTIEQYAQSDVVENNWMVRQLSNAYEGDLTQQHLDVAMDIIRRKFLVGLLKEKRRTMDRVEKFFRFKFRVKPDNQEKCREKLLTEGANSNAANKKEKPKPGDPGYDLLAAQNQLDIQLYEYIVSLFEEQEQFVEGISDDYRNIDATCAKCVPPTFPPLPGAATAPAGGAIMGEAPAEIPAGTGSVLDLPMPQGPELPVPELAGFKDVTDPFEDTDLPLFWHIPKAGGSTVKDIMGTCHRFTLASEAGVYEGHDQDTEIKVVRPGGVPADQDPTPYANVDITTIPGIQRAAALGFAASGLADFGSTSYVAEAEELFDPQHRGRFFTVFRHPVDRAVSLFFYLQVADWEPTYNPELAKWTVSDYAKSPLIENNWMVRQLTGAYGGDLTEQHLNVAKEVVRRKFLVGLLHEKQRTMDRVEKFFRFKYRVMPENQEKCRERLLTGGSNSNEGNKKEKPKKGDESWELVAWQNVMDIKLYEYVLELFEEQEALVADVPDGYRSIDATCAKCVPPTFPALTKEVL